MSMRNAALQFRYCTMLITTVSVSFIISTGSDPNKNILAFNPDSAGIDFSRQILTSNVDPRTVRVKIFIMAIDP